MTFTRDFDGLITDLTNFKSLLKHKMDLLGIDYSNTSDNLTDLTLTLANNSGLVTAPDYTNSTSLYAKLNTYRQFLENVLELEYNVNLLVENSNAYNGLTSLLNLLKVTPTVTLASNPAYGSVGDNVTLNAIVTYNDNSVGSGVTINFYKNSNSTTSGTLIGTVTTDSNGVASLQDYTLTEDNYFYCEVVENDDYEEVTSEDMNILSYLFYDECKDNSNLSLYSDTYPQIKRHTNSVITMNMEYDSNMNAYKLYGSGEWFGVKLIKALDGLDNIQIEAKLYTTVNQWTNTVGICKYPSDTDYMSKSSYTYRVRGNNTYDYREVKVNDNTVNYDSDNDSYMPTHKKWMRIVVIFDGATCTGKWYDENDNLLLEKTKTIEDYPNPRYGLSLATELGTTNSICYVKDIKVIQL